MLIHSTNKKCIGINDNLSAQLNASLSGKHFRHALEKALHTFVTNFAFESNYCAIYLNHKMTEQLCEFVKQISMENECDIYII